MYKLTIFVLVSSAISQKLVGAVGKEGSPSGRSNLYFDSYNQPSLEEFEESGDDLRGAVLLHPEEVLEIPPTSVDYGADLGYENSLEDYPTENLRDSQVTRGFFHNILEQIQAAFSKWPPGLPTNKPHNEKVFYYYFDDSLDGTQRTRLEELLKNVEEKTCTEMVEDQESPDVIFMGIQGCSISLLGNKLIIGYECYEPTMIYKLVFKRSQICAQVFPTPVFKSSGLHLDSFRNKVQRDADTDTECADAFGFCVFLSGPDVTKGPMSCSGNLYAYTRMCPRTCRVCGDSCVDYDSDCKTNDTLRDCLLNWKHKKLGCANTCGLCRNPKRQEYCMDLVNCCRDLAQHGYCPKFPDLMKDFCPMSCGYCKPQSCVDERSDCFELKRLGGCTKMPDLMGKNCRKTCSFCEDGVTDRDNNERKPPENCSMDLDFIQKFCTWDGNLIAK